MPFDFVELDEAKTRDGMRMVVVPGLPSPWGEAAKGILHIKKIPWVAVRLNAGSDEMAEWMGGARSGPVAVYNDEPPRSGWAEILLLTERVGFEPALLPEDAADRAMVMGLSYEICGEMGLGWCRRNAGTHSGLKGEGGFPKEIAAYLANKYGYREEESDEYQRRVLAILGVLSARLEAQKAAGSSFLVGSTVTAADIYCATFMALFKPLPPDQCPMPDAIRVGFEAMDTATAAALTPSLLAHRDFIYEEYLELPMTL
jgi:glutathione S-transferase